MRTGQKRPATSPVPLLPSPSLQHHAGMSSNHVSPHLMVNSTAATASNPSVASGRGPFASALRNLAKQADTKEEDVVDKRIATTESNPNSSHMQHRSSANSEQRTIEKSVVTENKAVSDEKNRNRAASPQQPPEKVCIMLFRLIIFLNPIISRSNFRFHE